jgi:hypothetical protein
MLQDGAASRLPVYRTSLSGDPCPQRSSGSSRESVESVAFLVLVTHYALKFQLSHRLQSRGRGLKEPRRAVEDVKGRLVRKTCQEIRVRVSGLLLVGHPENSPVIEQSPDK